MDELQEARREIDRVDRQMAQLFCRRMAAVRQVARYKARCGMAILDTGREEEVLAHNLAQLPDPQLAPYYEEYLRSQMELSRRYQAQLLAAEQPEKKDGL